MFVLIETYIWRIDDVVESLSDFGVSFNKIELPPVKSDNVLIADAKTRSALAISHFDGEKFVCLRGLWS